MAKKDLKYFMRNTEPEIVTFPGPESFKDDEGNVIQFEVKTLSQEEITEINDNYKHRGIATDKKGNPLAYNGEVIWKTEKDSAKAVRHIIVEALQYPDLKDTKLMEHFHCVDITDMPLKVFWRPEEYQYVVRNVLQIIGMASGPEDNLEEAKNS